MLHMIVKLLHRRRMALACFGVESEDYVKRRRGKGWGGVRVETDAGGEVSREAGVGEGWERREGVQRLEDDREEGKEREEGEEGEL